MQHKDAVEENITHKPQRTDTNFSRMLHIVEQFVGMTPIEAVLKGSWKTTERRERKGDRDRETNWRVRWNHDQTQYK